jgi:hypothetical protein
VQVAEHRGDVAQQMLAVQRLDLDGDLEGARRLDGPVDRDEPVGLALQVPDVGAVGPVDETPRPRVTKPTISSPGTGVQHRASCTIMPLSPSTRTSSALPGTIWIGAGPSTPAPRARAPSR